MGEDVAPFPLEGPTPATLAGEQSGTVAAQRYRELFTEEVTRFETNEHALSILKRRVSVCLLIGPGSTSWQLIGRLGSTWIHCLGNRLRPGHVRIYPQTSDAVPNASFEFQTV